MHGIKIYEINLKVKESTANPFRIYFMSRLTNLFHFFLLDKINLNTHIDLYTHASDLS